MPFPISALPTVNATLNGIAAVLLGLGRYQIARKHVLAHRRVMLTAFATSILFLVSYLYYHFHTGLHRFQHPGPVRAFYLALLFTHTVCAILLVPMILVTLNRALHARYSLHRAIARWTWPVWMYVSVTGVIVYLMLYHLDR